jgi:predicted O-linked N-acetylglucosamine transferase (SPINDLY family)
MSIEARLAQAKAYHLAGALGEARRLYDGVLADEPANDEAAFRLGILEWQTGDANAALARVGAALALQPAQLRYRLGQAQLFASLGRFDEAIAACHGLLTDEPGCTDGWFALASALEADGRPADAAQAYGALLELEPDHADALNNLGNCRRRLGERAAAEAAYRRALCVRPGFADALTNLATLLQSQGFIDNAIELLYEAARTEPDTAAHHTNLGIALAARRRFDEALPPLRRARTLDPNNADIAYNAGTALHALGRHAEAVAEYATAIALAPAHADACNNLGVVLKELGEFAAAAEAFDAALAARPAFAAARNNAGSLARTLGRMDDAQRHYRAALDLLSGEAAAGNPLLDTERSATYNNLGNVLKDTGALDAAVDCYRQALACDAGNLVAHSNLAYALTFQSDDGYALLAECRRLAAHHEAPLRAGPRAHRNAPMPEKRLRIGYVSADFRDHCQSLFTVPLFAHHDHGPFEIVCYSSVERPDAMTRRLARHTDLWRDVRELDDDRLASLIRDDRIDVLIDLTMHMADGRPLLFARRPAPVQVAWLAYPGTTGSDAIGYRLTDPWLDPIDGGAARGDDRYSERSIRLPDSFWCYDALSDEPAATALPVLRNGYVTFGCLNNPCKLTPHTMRLWARVLGAVPESRLRLLAPEGRARDRIAAGLTLQGISAERVEFVAFRPRREYLRTYHEIDLALDTFPYNGHTTSLDALWMGVPVVTRVGTTPAARGGLSQLSNLGLRELAAYTDDDYVQAATALANDVDRLSALRAGLRARMQASPLMQAGRFARHIEQAYRAMWREWCMQGAGASDEPCFSAD